MKAGARASRRAGAVAVGTSSLLFLLFGPVLSTLGAMRADGNGAARISIYRAETPPGGSAVATNNSSGCVKCHSACENGRSHIGLAPIGLPGAAALPLDAEGRTMCVTCHDSQDHGVQGGAGDHLRISNLRRELCLNCHRQSSDSDPRIEIVSPFERAVVHEERLAFIGRASHLSGSDLTVRLNGAEFHLHVQDGEFSTWLRLQDGVNRIEVAQQEHLLWQGEVFHGESSLGSYRLVSSGHRTGNRAQCQECHQRKDELDSGVAGSAPALCYGCHDRIDDKRYVHGPLAVGDCLACHDPHGGYGTAHLRREKALLCANCHSARDNTATVACNSSGKACVDCHDPHQSDRRYLLKGPQYTMR